MSTHTIPGKLLQLTSLYSTLLLLHLPAAIPDPAVAKTAAATKGHLLEVPTHQVKLISYNKLVIHSPAKFPYAQ